MSPFSKKIATLGWRYKVYSVLKIIGSMHQKFRKVKL
jgi:hypothetical protein